TRAGIGRGKAGSGPEGTMGNASQSGRPTGRSLMSVPTSRTSRSPLRRNAFSSAAVPGAPDAVTMTVIGFTGGTYRRSGRGSREVDAVVPQMLEPRFPVRVQHRLHR